MVMPIAARAMDSMSIAHPATDLRPGNGIAMKKKSSAPIMESSAPEVTSETITASSAAVDPDLQEEEERHEADGGQGDGVESEALSSRSHIPCAATTPA